MSNNIKTLIATGNTTDAKTLKESLPTDVCLISIVFESDQINVYANYDLVIINADILKDFSGSDVKNFLSGVVVVYSENGFCDDFSEFNISFFFTQCPTQAMINSVIGSINLQRRDLPKSYDIVHTLYGLGISSNLKGFGYLKSAIELVLEDREYLSFVTKQLYPKLAKMYSTTPSAIERGIRHVAEKVRKEGTGTEMFLAMNYKNTHCTNAEFIALVSDFITMFRTFTK